MRDLVARLAFLHLSANPALRLQGAEMALSLGDRLSADERETLIACACFAAALHDADPNPPPLVPHLPALERLPGWWARPLAGEVGDAWCVVRPMGPERWQCDTLHHRPFGSRLGAVRCSTGLPGLWGSYVWTAERGVSPALQLLPFHPMRSVSRMGVDLWRADPPAAASPLLRLAVGLVSVLHLLWDTPTADLPARLSDILPIPATDPQTLTEAIARVRASLGNSGQTFHLGEAQPGLVLVMGYAADATDAKDLTRILLRCDTGIACLAEVSRAA